MYDFKQLSAADFEDLTRDLLQREWGVRLESFKKGRDKGIDLRYSRTLDGGLIVQCKHYAGSDVPHLVRDLREKEQAKVAKLKPQRYVVVTSLALNPGDKDKIIEALTPYCDSPHDVIGAEDLNNLLGIHREVETKHFKLWLSSTAVLQRVLLNAEQVQTDFDVDRVRRSIPLYVQNKNYSRAMEILEERRFVIISGVPGIGKTTLADMLLFAHLDAGYQPVTIKSDISEAKRQFATNAKQIFYFDDFLGETFLGHRHDFVGRKEDSAILDFVEMVARSKHSRLILTSREHILQHAFQISERFSRNQGALADHRCIMHLNDYSLLERGRILYNHIYFSDLPEHYRQELLRHKFYMRILKHRNFNPRLVEWLSRFTNVKALPAENYQAEVGRILDNPEQLWRIAFEQQVSEASRSLLLALYSLGGEAHLDRLEEVWRALHQYRAKKYQWNASAEDWRRSLQDLEGGFLAFDNRHAAFVNPSVKDFFDAALARDFDHAADILDAAVLFEQVVHVWSLARSDKGIPLLQRFKSTPSSLRRAIDCTLHGAHQVTFEIGGGRAFRNRDVRPEVRLHTILSIAYRIAPQDMLSTVTAYSGEVIEFWEDGRVDFSTGAIILRALDKSGWTEPEIFKVHQDLKSALLAELHHGGRSGDFSALADYATGEGARWSGDDQLSFMTSFKTYLRENFLDELYDCSDDSELEDLSSGLRSSAALCDVSVAAYDKKIDERSGSFDRDSDDDDRSISRWEGGGPAEPVFSEEGEIERLFDGLD